MLDYDEFKKEVISGFMDFMGKSYEDYELTTMPVTKRGRKLDAFSLRRKDGGTDDHGNSIMPTLYFNDMYRSYLESDDICFEMEKCAQGPYTWNQPMRGPAFASRIEISSCLLTPVPHCSIIKCEHTFSGCGQKRRSI